LSEPIGSSELARDEPMSPVDSDAFWVCGTFEVRDGRITLWRDRFDYADLTWAFLRGTAAGLLRRG
jgi:limonene-1,2-epoxide hydrolase